MPKALIVAIVGVFLSTSALAGSGCFGVSHSEQTASTATQSTPATTAETPAPKTAKPESKS